MNKTHYLVHTLNASPSKEAHSFGVSQRFAREKSKGQFKYNISEIKSKIGTKFGRDHRLNNQRVYDQTAPSPNKYTIKSQFDNTDKGFSFGRPFSPTKTRQTAAQWRQPNYLTPQKIRQRSYIYYNVNDGKSPKGRSRLSTTPTLNRHETQTRYGRGISPIKDSPGPGYYNIFSEFGPLNYYR